MRRWSPSARLANRAAPEDAASQPRREHAEPGLTASARPVALGGGVILSTCSGDRLRSRGAAIRDRRRSVTMDTDMTIELDHVIVSARDQRVSARRLADILGVPWAETGPGPFSPVYVNDGLTLDFIDDAGPFPVQHFCFRVSDGEFDAILRRIEARGIGYRSTVRGPEDRQVNTLHGGRIVYWNEPDGHQWELLTVSYARQRA